VDGSVTGELGALSRVAMGGVERGSGGGEATGEVESGPGSGLDGGGVWDEVEDWAVGRAMDGVGALVVAVDGPTSRGGPEGFSSGHLGKRKQK
jgi:hypothetical protein